MHQHNAKQTVVAVVEQLDESLSNTLQQSVNDNLPGHVLEVLDRATFETIQRLIENGVLTLNPQAQTLHQSTAMEKPQQEAKIRRLSKARKRLQQAERKHSMAQVLSNGGFVIEALPALSEALEGGLESLALLDNHETTPLTIAFIESLQINGTMTPSRTAALVAKLREGDKGVNQKEAALLLNNGSTLMQQITETLNKAALQ